MDSPDILFNENVGLAEVIALEYTNIPNASSSDALSEAQGALLRASENFKPERGDFTPYAARAVRNALNSFYAKQLKIARIFPVSLDASPDWKSSGGAGESSDESGLSFADSGKDVFNQVRRKETQSVLDEVLKYLSPRERLVIEGLQAGKSLSEIGEGMGITKQAIHKISSPALQKLRTRLEFLGYQSLDSKGFLKTDSGVG